MVGLRAYAGARARARPRASATPSGASAGAARAADAEALLRAGGAAWPRRSTRSRARRPGPSGPSGCRRSSTSGSARERDREAVRDVIADLAGLGVRRRPRRLERGRAACSRRASSGSACPLEPPATGGAIHVGAMDAMAGLPFRVVAIPGLVEGGYPGRAPARSVPARPGARGAEPRRRAACPRRARRPAPNAPALAVRRRRAAAGGRHAPPTPRVAPARPRRTACSRRGALFHRAISPGHGAPDPLLPARRRAQRARAAALALLRGRGRRRSRGRPLGRAELDARSWRGRPRRAAARGRARRGRARPAPRAARRRRGRRADRGRLVLLQAVAPRARRRAGRAGSRRYDGLVAADLPADARRARARPARRRAIPSRPAAWPLRRAAASSTCCSTCCGWRPRREPEERKRLEPLERGNLFHEVAERFLRERRDRGELPVRDTPETRASRLAELADEALDGPGGGQPAALHAALGARARALPRHAAGVAGARGRRGAGARRPPTSRWASACARAGAPGEPALAASRCAIDLGDGRVLRVSGKIDRIDRRPDGAPRAARLQDRPGARATTAGSSAAGKQLQIPFYVLAAAAALPRRAVVEAFLDYVDGGRQVAFDPDARAAATPSAAAARTSSTRSRQGVFVQEPAACDVVRLHGGLRAQAAARAAAPATSIGDPRLQRVPAPAGHRDERASARPTRTRASARARRPRRPAWCWRPAPAPARRRCSSTASRRSCAAGARALDRDRGRHLHRERRHHHEAAAARAAGARAGRRRRAGGRSAARVAAALDVLERAQVSTIHALCAAILQERPLECGVLPGLPRWPTRREADAALRRGLGGVAGRAAGAAATTSCSRRSDRGIPLEGDGPCGERTLAARPGAHALEQRDLAPLARGGRAVDPTRVARELLEKGERARGQLAATVRAGRPARGAPREARRRSRETCALPQGRATRGRAPAARRRGRRRQLRLQAALAARPRRSPRAAQIAGWTKDARASAGRRRSAPSLHGRLVARAARASCERYERRRPSAACSTSWTCC